MAGPLLLGLAVGGLIAAVGVSYMFRKWVAGGVCHSKATLTGKTVIITGSNTGIGLETAVDLAKRGARVILACRDVEKGERAAVEVRRRSGNVNVIFLKLDLASLQSVRRFAENILREEPCIDILINNAGISLTSSQKTVDGFEAHMGVNHLGHFLLTNLLLNHLKESPSARIVTVSSVLYKRCEFFDFENMNSVDPSRYLQKMPGMAYSQSKLANILFSRHLAKILEGTNVATYVLCPGLIRTQLARYFLKVMSFPRKVLIIILAYLLIKSPYQGAQTTIYCAVAEELEGVSGRFYRDCSEKELVTAAAMDDQVAEKLWKVSAELVGLEK